MISMSIDAPARTFLFLSESNSESATSRLAVAGIPYIKKKLESGSANWWAISAIIDEGEVTAVLAKLTTHTLRAMISPGYRSAADELLRRVAALPNLVFVHASLFDMPVVSTEIEDGDEDEWFGAAAHFGSLEQREREDVMETLTRHGIEVMPYRRNVELSVLAAQFVDDNRHNLVFRFYVPANRLWADQAKDLLDLFTDYLRKALGLGIRTSSHASSGGTTYEFFGDGDLPADAIEARLPGFAQAMDLCVRDPDGAERLLVDQGADASDAMRLVTSYARKMRRIATDARHEREQKVLNLRHRFENELDAIAGNADPAVIAMVIDQVVPRIDQAASLVLGVTDPMNLPAATSVTLNYRPQFIEHVQGMVAQEVSGTQNFGPDARALLDLIRRDGGERSADLTSALQMLEGGGLPDASRLDALGRLRAFLGKAATKVGDKALDAAVAAAQAYIQTRFRT